MEQLAITSMIRREMKNRSISGPQLSRSLGLSVKTMTTMLRGTTIQAQRLADISELLKYNFFREVAQQLPINEPVSGEVAALQNRVQELEMENKILRQTMKDLFYTPKV